MAAPDVDLDYGVYATLDEVLLEAMDQLEQARHSNDVALEHHLKMASRAMRNALEIYGNHLMARIMEKK